jgi:IS5 family transposase
MRRASSLLSSFGAERPPGTRAGRYAHAKQFNRHRRQLRILRTRLGRIIRDIHRKIAGRAELEATFTWPLARASHRSKEQPDLIS